MVLDTEDLTNTTLHQIHILVMTWVKNSTLSTLGSWISWTSWWGVAATHNSPPNEATEHPYFYNVLQDQAQMHSSSMPGSG